MTKLVDTSVWIEFLRNPAAALRHSLEANEDIGYTEPVLMELLAGCRSPREESAIERLLGRGRLLSFHSESGFVTAAKVYQQARRNGITPNSFVDCMIITAARNHGAILLTDDANQRRVAQLVDVAVAP
jgi:predicted nucleic acid-binding protein